MAVLTECDDVMRVDPPTSLRYTYSLSLYMLWISASYLVVPLSPAANTHVLLQRDVIYFTGSCKTHSILVGILARVQ